MVIKKKYHAHDKTKISQPVRSQETYFTSLTSHFVTRIVTCSSFHFGEVPQNFLVDGFHLLMLEDVNDDLFRARIDESTNQAFRAFPVFRSAMKSVPTVGFEFHLTVAAFGDFVHLHMGIEPVGAEKPSIA